MSAVSASYAEALYDLCLEQSITESYSTTLHIDPGAVLEVNNSTGEYADHELSSSGGRWPQEAIRVIERIEKGGA